MNSCTPWFRQKQNVRLQESIQTFAVTSSENLYALCHTSHSHRVCCSQRTIDTPPELPSYPRVDVHNMASSMLQKLGLGHRTMQNILTPETEVLQPEDNLVLEFLDFVI